MKGKDTLMKDRIATDAAFVATGIGGWITLHDLNEIMATAGGVIAIFIGLVRLYIVVKEAKKK